MGRPLNLSLTDELRAFVEQRSGDGDRRPRGDRCLFRDTAERSLAQFEAAFGMLRFYRVEKHWLVCDRIGDAIYVLTVKHGAMDLPERIAELEPQLIHEATLMRRRVPGV